MLKRSEVKDLRASAAALYDGGWRAHDRDQLVDEYNLTEEDADAICISLHEYAGDVVNASGTWINYEAAVGYMDDDIREDLHADLAPCSNQEFFTAYEIAHEKRTGEPWFLSAANPTW
jgi:hypothetical protein